MEKIMIQSKHEAIVGGKIVVGLIGMGSLLCLISLFVGEKRMDLSKKNDLGWFLFFFLIFAVVNGQFFLENVLSQYRKIIMDQNGCTVSWFGFCKRHKWEDLQVIREDCWVSRKQEYDGIVFSVKRGKKNKNSRKIYESYDFLNCFYVVFYINDHKSYQYPVKRDEFVEQLNKWGIEVEIAREAKLKKRRQYALEEGMRRRKQRLESVKKN